LKSGQLFIAGNCLLTGNIEVYEHTTRMQIIGKTLLKKNKNVDEIL